jgi:uncharacterized membrane protein YphA (DoxX/SURF4 family)
MKFKKIAITVYTVLVTSMVVMSGIMKLFGLKEAVDTLTKVGVGDYITLLGIMEIVFAGLFLYPATRKLGVLFLTAYFAGAMATDLSHGMPVINAAFTLALVWIAAFWNDTSIFLPVKKD